MSGPSKNDSGAGAIVFTGREGLTCHQFIRAIREQALEYRYQSNDHWLADFAAVRFDGDALIWFESLDDETRTNWKLLRRALISQYGSDNHSNVYVAEGEKSVFTFTGKDKDECRAFIGEIRLRASEQGKSNDQEWMLRLALPCFVGDALQWHASLPHEVEANWWNLEKAILFDYPSSPIHAICPARIHVKDWLDRVPPSQSLRNVRNQEDWLRRARERLRLYRELKDKFTPCWVLAETEKDIPQIALVTGFERSGEPLYSARAWQEGFGLIVGRCGIHMSGAGLPINGREVEGVKPFEVLVGDPSSFQWVAVPYQMERRSPIVHRPFTGVDAGGELGTRHDRATFICQFQYEGGLYPGKVHSSHPTAEIGQGGEERKRMTHDARILAWAD